jgi:hypothetical protein
MARHGKEIQFNIKKNKGDAMSNKIQQKISPQSIENEKVVLGGMLHNPECIKEICEIVREDDFYSKKNRKIFRHIVQMYRLDQAVSVPTLCDRLDKARELEPEDINYIVDLPNNTTGPIHSKQAAKKVKDLSNKRKLIELIELRKSNLYCPDVDLNAEIQSFEEGLSKLRNEIPSQCPAINIDDILAVSDESIKWLVKNFIPQGGVVDFFGAPSSGKTTFILCLLFAAVTGSNLYPLQIEGNRKVLIVGGEKSSLGDWKRSFEFAKRTLGINNSGLINNKIQILDTFSTPERLQNKYLLRLENKEWAKTRTWWDMTRVIESFKPDIILFDTLSSCFLGYSPLLWVEHQKLILKLTLLAKQYDLTIFTVSHTNQTSRFEPLAKRLDYTARSGNNGIPGELRCLLGFSTLHKKEIKALELDNTGQYIACCVSKANDFLPRNNVWNPLVFQFYGGRMRYVREVDTLQLEEASKKKSKSSKSQSTSTSTKKLVW